MQFWLSPLMAFSHIRDDISGKQARRQISLLTSYGGARPNHMVGLAPIIVLGNIPVLQGGTKFIPVTLLRILLYQYHVFCGLEVAMML